MMTASDWIQIALGSVGILVTVGLAVCSAVGGVLVWFVVRFFTATDDKLAKIIEKVDGAITQISAHAAHRENDRRDIDNHAAVLGEHTVKLAEHDGHFSSILGNRQNG